MTEWEWLKSDDPAAMLAGVLAPGHPTFNFAGAVPPSDRKLRLFACACARAMGVGGRAAEEIILPAEWTADGDRSLLPLKNRPAMPGVEWCYAASGLLAAEQWATADSIVPKPQRAAILRDIVGNPFRPATLCGMARKPFGTKGQFAHVAENGSFWLESECPACRDLRSPEAVNVATAAYRDRNADGTLDAQALRELSDALVDANCPGWVPCRACEGSLWFDEACQLCRGAKRVANPVPQHLRSAGPHWRGCWAVDLVLGKE